MTHNNVIEIFYFQIVLIIKIKIKIFNNFDAKHIIKNQLEKWPFRVDFMKFMKSTCLVLAVTFIYDKINECLKKSNKGPKIANVAGRITTPSLFSYLKKVVW